MTVEMVRGDVGDAGYMRMEIHDGLELEGAHLEDRRRGIRRFQCFGRKRITDVSTYMRIVVGRFKDFTDQGNRRGLAVRSSHGCKFPLAGPVRELDFTPDRDLRPIDQLHKRLIERDTRADNCEIYGYEIRRLQFSDHQGNPISLSEIFHHLHGVQLFIGIEQNDLSSQL